MFRMINSKKGFTLIELMVVAIIVAILAAVAIPLMRGNARQARASEAVAGCGSIKTALRAYFAQYDSYNVPLAAGETNMPWTNLHLIPTDFDGTYFTNANYVYLGDADAGRFTITCTGAAGTPAQGIQVTLYEGPRADNDGTPPGNGEPDVNINYTPPTP